MRYRLLAEAQRQRALADSARANADEQRADAVQARKDALAALASAKESEERATTNLYRADAEATRARDTLLLLAAREVEGDPAQANAYLRETSIGMASSAWRAAAWHTLQRVPSLWSGLVTGGL